MPREKKREQVTYHVVSSPGGGWNVKVEHIRRSTFTTETKQEAIKRAKDLARRQSLGQVVVHRADGAIQTERTYGKDPSPLPPVVQDLKKKPATGEKDKPIDVREFHDREESETEEIRPLKLKAPEKDSLAEIAAKIDAVYDEIRSLVAERKGDPKLKAALLPLRKKLEKLKAQEADAMELRFRSQLQYDPQEGRRLIARAKKLLGKR